MTIGYVINDLPPAEGRCPNQTCFEKGQKDLIYRVIKILTVMGEGVGR